MTAAIATVVMINAPSGQRKESSSDALAQTETVIQTYGPTDISGEDQADGSTATRQQRTPNELNVNVPMSHPPCDGSGIVVLANAVTPGRYDSDIQQYLNTYPGSSYLRTDESCSSLRGRDDAGNAIYAVYRSAGRTQAEVCAAVLAAGGNAYGKWLDNTTDPRQMIDC